MPAMALGLASVPFACLGHPPLLSRVHQAQMPSDVTQVPDLRDTAMPLLIVHPATASCAYVRASCAVNAGHAISHISW